MIKIRREQKMDYDQVRVVNDRAFGQPDEKSIVDKIRASCAEIVSLERSAFSRTSGCFHHLPLGN